MRFIVDESTGHAVVAHLRTDQHDVLAVAEVMPQADDDDILHLAVTENRILITNNKDFGELVYRSGLPHRGILLLRLNDESSVHRVRIVQSVLERYADQLEDAFVVATEHHVRIRAQRRQA
jgi:predicted nuclease of predicted toxin-antitoxin system